MKILPIGFILSCLFGLPMLAECQQPPIVQIRTEGSVPEVPGLYDCITQLGRAAYSPKNAQACLQAISETKYFTRAELKTRRLKNKRLELTFFLEAPTAIIRHFEIDTGDPEKNKLLAWLRLNPDNVHEGIPYSRSAEIATKIGIERYYSAQGLKVGVSSVVDLDYASHSARLAFSVTMGPKVPPEPVLPPYGSLCKDSVGAIDWSDFNQYVPIPLVQEVTKLNNVGACFSDEALNSDRRALEQLGIFSDVLLSYTGPVGFRQISLGLRSKPISVSAVSIREFGKSTDATSGQPPDLPLKAGAVYERANANASVKILELFFHAPDVQVAVSERDELTPDHVLVVYFEILFSPTDRLVINGHTVWPSGQSTASGSNVARAIDTSNE